MVHGPPDIKFSVEIPKSPFVAIENLTKLAHDPIPPYHSALFGCHLSPEMSMTVTCWNCQIFIDTHRIGPSGFPSHWIYQNSMLMSWPETTEHTNVLLMAQGFRNDLSFCSRPQIFFNLYGAHYIACKWQFHRSKKNLGSGAKRKYISESLGHREDVGVLRCFGSWH